MVEQLTPVIIEALTIIILALAAAFARWAVTWMKNVGITEAIIAYEELAMIAVQFAEQKYHDKGGPEKFALALDSLSKMLKSRGIKIEPEQIEALIESAVLEMHGEWMDIVE